CVICMMDFEYGDPIRFLPCMHIYHMDCIDDWLMMVLHLPLLHGACGRRAALLL
ncbi:hypothetical protein KUCAC02_016962, partial [Chaenocephalus aceratus]